MEDDLVTIRNYAFGPDPAGEAELARIRLESAGIPCFLADREFASMYWLYSGANRGVKLQVKRSDAERALEVLGPEPAAPDQKVEAEAGADESVAPLCPRCHSDEVVYERFSRASSTCLCSCSDSRCFGAGADTAVNVAAIHGDDRYLQAIGPTGMRIGPKERRAAGRNHCLRACRRRKKSPC